MYRFNWLGHFRLFKYWPATTTSLSSSTLQSTKLLGFTCSQAYWSNRLATCFPHLSLMQVQPIISPKYTQIHTNGQIDARPNSKSNPKPLRSLFFNRQFCIWGVDESPDVQWTVFLGLQIWRRLTEASPTRTANRKAPKKVSNFRLPKLTYSKYTR